MKEAPKLAKKKKISIKVGAPSPPLFIIIFHSPFIYFRLSPTFSLLTMPSKMILLFGVPMFVGCCTILWNYWDHFKKPPKPRRIHKKKIFISADCWLCVFDLITPSQLGLGIAMISHRFDIYVDEHFKTRKWTLAFIRIRGKIGENGTKEMEIVNSDGKSLPIPQIQLPRKVTGFEHIDIPYIDRNVITFLRRFRQLFAACPINWAIDTKSDRISECILHNIWPMLNKKICAMQLDAGVFHCLRQFVPTILNDFPSLRIVVLCGAEHFTEFPCDDSAMASDGQALANWLFTPLQNGVPKLLKCSLYMDGVNWSSNIEPFKAAFASASSSANFIVLILFVRHFVDFVEPFDLTNETTREQLALKRINESNFFLFVRCPIGRDEIKWAKLEEEAIVWQIHDQRNHIDIHLYREDAIGDGLLDATPGPSGQQWKVNE